jgi:hypothetical protein
VHPGWGKRRLAIGHRISNLHTMPTEVQNLSPQHSIPTTDNPAGFIGTKTI